MWTNSGGPIIEGGTSVSECGTGRFYGRERAVEHQQIGILQQRKGGMIADSNITLHIGIRPLHGRDVELRFFRSRDQHLSSAFGILPQPRRRPIARNHKVEITTGEPIHVVRDGEWNMLFGEEAEQAAIVFLRVAPAGIAGSAQQQNPRSARLAGKILLVFRRPPENRLGRFTACRSCKSSVPFTSKVSAPPFARFSQHRRAISPRGTVAKRQKKSTNCMFRFTAILPGWLLRARFTRSLAE